MLDYGEKFIYFVSDMNTGKISIIDSIVKNIIKEIEIGPGPHNIAVDDNDNVYVTDDFNITIINDLCESAKIRDVPNNGNIQVDTAAEKIYASNTEEIYICNLVNEKKIAFINGFTSADRLQLDKDRKRLFILDILKKEIKVYDTEKLKLIDIYKDVGIAPCDFILGEDGKYIYIANKGLKNKYYVCTINVLDIEAKKVFKMDMQKESNIKSLEQGGNYLYAVNSGLNRIEVIDIQKKQSISEIKLTLPIIERIRISKDKKILLAISRNNEGLSAIDLVDTDSFIIRDTLRFESSKLYDIGIIIQRETKNERKPLNDKESVVFMQLQDKIEEEN